MFEYAISVLTMCKDENVMGLKYCPKEDVKQVKAIVSELQKAIEVLEKEHK